MPQTRLKIPITIISQEASPDTWQNVGSWLVSSKDSSVSCETPRFVTFWGHFDKTVLVQGQNWVERKLFKLRKVLWAKGRSVAMGPTLENGMKKKKCMGGHPCVFTYEYVDAYPSAHNRQHFFE